MTREERYAKQERELWEFLLGAALSDQEQTQEAYTAWVMLNLFRQVADTEIEVLLSPERLEVGVKQLEDRKVFDLLEEEIQRVIETRNPGLKAELAEDFWMAYHEASAGVEGLMRATGHLLLGRGVAPLTRGFETLRKGLRKVERLARQNWELLAPQGRRYSEAQLASWREGAVMYGGNLLYEFWNGVESCSEGWGPAELAEYVTELRHGDVFTLDYGKELQEHLKGCDTCRKKIFVEGS